MKNYSIRDIFVAFRLAFNNFVYSFVFLGLGYLVVLGRFLEEDGTFNSEGKPNLSVPPELLNTIQTVFAVLAAIVVLHTIIVYIKNSRYKVDFDNQTISFPKTDIENSILAFLFAMPYWNLLRTQTVPFDEVDQVYVDTDRNVKGLAKEQWEKSKRAARKDKNNIYDNPILGFLGRLIVKVILNSILYPWMRKRIKTKYNLNILGSFGSANCQFSSRQKRDEVRNAIKQAIKASGRILDEEIAEFD